VCIKDRTSRGTTQLQIDRRWPQLVPDTFNSGWHLHQGNDHHHTIIVLGRSPSPQPVELSDTLPCDVTGGPL
jgi:hypothetical protein